MNFCRDHEEEFYYTEVEHPPLAPMAKLSLADHLDMARPAHEDPGQGHRLMMTGVPIRKKHVIRNEMILSRSLPTSSVTMPVTIAPSVMVGLILAYF